jgi:hypothetical protein
MDLPFNTFFDASRLLVTACHGLRRKRYWQGMDALRISQRDDGIEPWLLAHHAGNMPLPGQIFSQYHIAGTDAFNRAVAHFNFCFAS